MRIAVYSGTFNPLHVGHLAIMEYLTEKSDFDWVYLVVSPQNPFKSADNLCTAEQRYEAAVAAVKRHPELHVWVDDIEMKMSPPHYTIKTLSALQRREPDNEFTLVIGADNLTCIRGWRDFPRILRDYGVVVFPRKGHDAEAERQKLLEECALGPSPYGHDTETVSDDEEAHGMDGFENLRGYIYNIRILDMPEVDISSTEIRQGMAEGRDMSKYLM